MQNTKQNQAGERTQVVAKSWLWPDTRAPKPSVLRDEHNALVNAYAQLAEASKWFVEQYAEYVNSEEGDLPDVPALLENL